ncbi:DsbA family protein [Pseudolysinimonas sp.]|uniref:DsbA family protein n=1 Tax=Pseudolysinimonas sp. TaxID=2680009 RepID=UPI003F7E3667
MSDPAAPSEARAAARERARQLRDQHRKQDRRRRLIVTGSIVLGTLLVLAVVAGVLVNVSRPNARGPLNMASDGIKIGAGLKAERTVALQPGDKPIAAKKNPSTVLDVKIYVDYLCDQCGSFMQKDGAELRDFVDSGAATVEFHPIAVLTGKSAGTQYSSRAANAAACVAEFAPDDFFDFNSAMFVSQPKVNDPGLTDAQILARAANAQVSHLSDIRACVKDGRFRNWVQGATARALAGPIPNSSVTSVTQPPLILVNGKQFTYASNLSAEDFTAFMQQATGDEFSKNPTPTPTPTASPSATPAS